MWLYNLKQLDDYGSWIQVGIVLKNIGAPLELWEQLSKKSNK